MARKPPASAPWAPAPYDISLVVAIKALVRGEAEKHQQIRALQWIIETVCATYDLSFRPESERETAFAEGKRFVGLTLVKMNNADIQKLKRENHGRTSSEPR